MTAERRMLLPGRALVPNTFHAKVSGLEVPSGLDYLTAYASAYRVQAMRARGARVLERSGRDTHSNELD